MKTFKEYSSLNEVNNKVLGNFAVSMWGSKLYLDYGYLPSGPGNLKRLEPEILKYFKMNDDDKEDEEEWFAAGAPIGGKPLLTKQLFDQLLRLNEVKVKNSSGMTVWRAGEVRTEWNSFTTDEKSAKSYALGGAQSFIYKLPKGTKYIETNGYADKHEIIINKDQIPKGKKVI